jgi:hypothetical protein
MADPDATFNLGSLFWGQGNVPRAITAFERAQELSHDGASEILKRIREEFPNL